MDNLKVDKVVLCCDIGRCLQNNVGVCSNCDITNNHCLFSDGPVREQSPNDIAPDRGDVITKNVQVNPTTLYSDTVPATTQDKEPSTKSSRTA